MYTADYSTTCFTSQARTLDPDQLGTNDSEWTIEGQVMEDYYEWVNDFTATHPIYGKLQGNYEEEVVGETKEAIDHFVANHPPCEWDYYDI